MAWFPRVFWTMATAGGVYVLAMLAFTHPVVQRNATYAHRANPTMWQNISNVEQFGFIHHQVQPFTIKSTDNVTLYAWHILPVHLYSKHEEQLTQQVDFGMKPYAEAAHSVGLRLLLEDSNASLVVSFHGNAAHIGSSFRPATYQQILGLSTPEKPVHVIAFDYRGFGRSTGSPTETGVIEDGIALLSALCGKPSSLAIQDDSKHTTLKLSALKPSQIVLLGQSMGTFFSTATYHDWVIRLGQAPFKGLVLLASFKSLIELLESYSIKGLTPPLLSPLLQYPALQRWITSKVIDKWDTGRCLVDLLESSEPLDLTIMHSSNDWEIPHYEGKRNWDLIRAVTNGSGTLALGEEAPGSRVCLHTWTSDDGTKRVKWQKIRHGGHNQILTTEYLKLNLYQVLNR